MTALVGASVLLIAGSAIALVSGWITANESLIWTSIAASVAGAVCLSLAYFRSRVEAAQVARASRGRAPVPGAAAVPEEIEVPEEPEPAPVPEPALEPEAAEAPPATPTPSGAAEVVGVRTTKRFHRPECRYATAKSAQTMTKVDALAAGFAPCGVCKP